MLQNGTIRWVIPGSRLLQAYRAAKRQSGSPPGLGLVPGAPGVLKIRLYGPYLGVGVGRGQQIRYDADALNSCFGHFAEITFFDSAYTKNRNPNLSMEFPQSG
jgi:hypothetical protein